MSEVTRDGTATDATDGGVSADAAPMKDAHGDAPTNGAPGAAPKTSRMRRVLRAIAINGALLSFSLLFAAAVGEVAIRLVAPQQLIQLRPDLWQAADTLGWTHRVDVHTTINTGERTVTVHTDADGFRVGEAGRVADGIPVLLLGDSFTEALQVEYEQSFAGLLQERLPEAIGAPVAIRNAGIDGWSPGQYLARARQVLPREPFELVIVSIFVGNDVLPVRMDYVAPREAMERHELRLPHNLSRAELTDALLRPLNDALEVRSHLFVFAKNRLQTLRMRAGLSPLYFPPEFRKSEAESERWQIIGDLAADIAQAAADQGARTLFVLIPAPYQVDAAAFDQYVRGFGVDPATVDLEQPTRLVRAQLDARGLESLDLLPPFRAAQAEGATLYGSVDPHLTPRGHEVMVGALLPVAAELLAR